MIVVGVLLAVALVAFILFHMNSDSSEENEYKTEEITRRDIVRSVSGTGVLKAKNSREVTADLAGSEIKAVYVSEGDFVRKGDKLLAFDVDNIRDQRDDTVKSRDDAIESKEQTISDREEQDARFDREMEEEYDEYHMNLEIARENMNTANANYEDARKDLAEYQKQYNQTDFSSASAETKSQMDLILTQKKQNVETARNSKNAARQSYETILNSDDNSLPDAKKNYDDMADDAVENYDRLIENYDEAIENYNDRLKDAVLKAPADGTVTELYAEVGDTYYGGNLCVIEGTKLLYIEAAVGEYDIPDVKKDMRVVIKTNATRDEELAGKVSYVAPKAGGGAGTGEGILSSLGSSMGGGMDLSDISSLNSTGSSDADYTVRIDLDSPNDRLRIGMNAKISIILEEVSNVTSVPMEAVSVLDDGTKVIYLVKEGESDAADNKEKKKLFNFGKKDEEEETEKNLSAMYDEVKVETGLEGTYYVQIITDQNIEGRQVVIPDSDSIQSVDDLLNVMGTAGGI